MSGRDIDLYNLQELWEKQKTETEEETQKRVVAFLTNEIIALKERVKTLEKEKEMLTWENDVLRKRWGK